jgi:hypothetical protein
LFAESTAQNVDGVCGLSYNLLLLKKRFPNAAACLDRQSIVPLPTLLAFIEHLP